MLFGGGDGGCGEGEGGDEGESLNPAGIVAQNERKEMSGV